MRAAVVCVLALAFVAFAAGVRAADVEMVEAELVDANHPALMEVVQQRAVVRGVGDKLKKPQGKKSKAAGKAKSAKAKLPQHAGKDKVRTKKPTKVKEPKFNGNTGIAGGIPGASAVPGAKAGGRTTRFPRGGAKGGQKADGWDPYGKQKGAKGKKKVKGNFPKPGDGPTKTIGGHGTGAFGGQESEGWDPNAYEDKAVNRDATKGGPIGGAFSKLFGHKMGEPKPSSGPLTGKPPQFRKP